KKTYLRCYVRPYLCAMLLKKIDNNIRQNLFNLLLDKKGEEATTEGKQIQGGKGLAPSTVKGVRKLLKAVFNYAINRQLITDNPAHNTKLPPAPASSGSSFTIEEAYAFISVKDDFWFGNAFVLQL